MKKQKHSFHVHMFILTASLVLVLLGIALVRQEKIVIGIIDIVVGWLMYLYLL